MNSLKLYSGLLILTLLITVLVLPLPWMTRLFILVVLAFCAVFVFVEASNKGKIFAGLVVALLTLYLSLTVQRGVLFLEERSFAGVLLGVGLIVLPVLGAWAMVREIIFGARTAQLAKILDAVGELPEDTLPRTSSGKVVQEAADAEFVKFQQRVEKDPENWKHWFNLSCLYDVARDRKRARKSMRIAIALERGKIPRELSV